TSTSAFSADRASETLKPARQRSSLRRIVGTESLADCVVRFTSVTTIAAGTMPSGNFAGAVSRATQTTFTPVKVAAVAASASATTSVSPTGSARTTGAPGLPGANVNEWKYAASSSAWPSP